MPLLRTTASEILTRFANPKDLSEHMAQQARYEGLGCSPRERASWEKSIPELAKVLKTAGLEDVVVLLEHKLPLTSKRVDAILAGTHPTTGLPSYVLVELKQWSAATTFEDDPHLMNVPNAPGSPHLHPARQVDGYRNILTNFAVIFDGFPNRLASAVYLHNATTRAHVSDLDDYVSELNTPVFTGAEVDKFASFLQRHLTSEAGTSNKAADSLMDSAIAPAQQLLEVAATEIRDREEFSLLDNQQKAVDMVLHEVDKADKSDHKRVIVVSGGPGTGKSVIALSLLGELARQGKKVLHATGSRSFTETMKKAAGHRHRATQDLFKYFNSFNDADKHTLDVLIADEAHRIRETSTNRWTPAAKRSDRPQVDELMDVARTPVFLLDEFQVVRPGELGSLHEITSFAKKKELDVTHIELTEQFRCGGSLVYTNWVEEILGLDPADSDALEERTEIDMGDWDFDYADVSNVTVQRLDPENPPILADDQINLRVADSPEEMETLLLTKMSEGYSARIAAGFCWRWSKVEKGQKHLDPDVRIGEWERPWNNPETRQVGDAPPSYRWSSGDGGFGQIGCIYTAQGFEYDWAGVIIGPDLVWRNGSFQTVRDANKDPALNKKSLSDHEFDVLVRHIYKVLLTRGMQGTVIYSPDPETRQALKALANVDDSEVK